MSPQAEKNVAITWRVVALGLLSFIAWFLMRINDKIDYSYEANVKQQIINENTWTKLNEHSTELRHVSGEVARLSSDVKKLDLDLYKLSDRQFNIVQGRQN